VTTGREAGRTIAGVSIVSRWLQPVVVTLVVELITLGGSTGGQHRLLARDMDAVGVALLVAAAGTTLVARRWPAPALAAALGCTVAYLGLGYQADSPFFLGLAVTAYLSGAAGARARAAVFAGVALAAFAVAAVVGPAEARSGAPGFAVIVLGALAGGQAAAEWRARADRRARQAHEDEALRWVAEERLRIARDVHDIVSHSIATINVQAGVALHVIDERPEQARAALTAIKAASRDALRDLRGILGLLRDADAAEPRAPTAGLAELPELVDRIRRTGVDVSLRREEDGGPLPAAVDLAAYRVVQEALTNVVRHAPGAVARIRVRRAGGELLVEVEDDGGAPVAEGRPGAGHGLLGMRERVRAVGGTLDAGPRAERGFAVRARLPLPEAAP
jgi:signal transduction histidine kinase